MMLGLLELIGCAGKRPASLGVRDGQLMACPASPNCVASLATDDRHRITPLSFSDAPDQAFMRLKQVLRARPDTTGVEDQADYIRVELRTRLFIDDAEFLLDRTSRLIHLRSASRLGYSDLGTNRRRIEELRTQFRQTGL
jgi:uncharacterized protein (DUF1499 family)